MPQSRDALRRKPAPHCVKALQFFMPPSMRFQVSKAVDLLEGDLKVAEVVLQSGVSRGTADRIKYALMNDKAMLQQMLCPSKIVPNTGL